MQPPILAEVKCEREMRVALRRRADALGVSRRVLDEVCELSNGHVAKILCEPPIKGLGMLSMWLLIRALGLKVILTEDPELMSTTRELPQRDLRAVRTGSFRFRWSGEMKAELVRRASIGGTARFKKMTPAELRAHQRRAAKSRWRRAHASRLGMHI